MHAKTAGNSIARAGILDGQISLAERPGER